MRNACRVGDDRLLPRIRCPAGRHSRSWIRVWPKPVTASANTIELRTLDIGVSCCSLKRILTYKCRASDHVTSGHVIQWPRTEPLRGSRWTKSPKLTGSPLYEMDRLNNIFFNHNPSTHGESKYTWWYWLRLSYTGVLSEDRGKVTARSNEVKWGQMGGNGFFFVFAHLRCLLW